MKYCQKCKVNVNTTRMTCPLCRDILIERDQNHHLELYPQHTEHKKKFHIARKICSFISLIICSVCLLVNILTYKHMLWSLVVICGVLYLWTLVKGTILSRRNIARKLIFQAVTIACLLLSIQLLTPNTHWLVPYALPFVMVGTIFAITLLIFIKTMRYKDYMLYLIVVALVGILPILLSFINSIKPLFIVNDQLILWPSIVSAVYAIFTIIGMFIFGDRATKDEFKKRFHI